MARISNKKKKNRGDHILLMNMLYKKHNYKDQNVTFLFSQEIYEYDIKSAGLNLIKKYKLLDKDKIKELENMPKNKRNKEIGLIQRHDKELAKKLSDCFVEARRLFFEANELKEEEILSIKKDAIFTLKYCQHTKFDNIEFVVKNYYSSYLYLNNIQFFYYKGKIDVKGFTATSHLHEDYMLDFMKEFIRLLETNSREKAIRFLKQFMHLYKTRQLEIGYYREMNSESLYKTNIEVFNDRLYVNFSGDYDNLDISYNYINYLIPLVQILL